MRTISILLFILLISCNFPTVKGAEPLAPPEVNTFGQERYLRMRWQGPVSQLEPMDVTLCFDEKGVFKRGWAFCDEYNREDFFAGNRHSYTHVEKRITSEGLVLKGGTLRGQLNIFFRSPLAPTQFKVDLHIKGEKASGSWKILSRGDETPLPEQPFTGRYSSNVIELKLPKGVRPAGLGIDDEFHVRFSKNRHSQWSATGSFGPDRRGRKKLKVEDLNIDGQAISIQLGMFDTFISKEFVMQGQDHYWNEYRFVGRIIDGATTSKGLEIRGSCSGIYNKQDALHGTITGHLQSETQMAAANPLDPTLDFSSYLGPFSDWSVRKQKVKLVDDLRNAHLLWKSELTPPGRPALSHQEGISGGGFSPILYDGKIYQYYLRPAGPYLDSQASVPPTDGSKHLIDRWRIAADDYLLCIDARTGRTLWRTRLPLWGLNYAHMSKSGGNMTPCAGDGKIFTLSSTLRLSAFDADTGTMLWHTDLGSRHRYLESEKRKAINSKTHYSGWVRDHNGAPLFVDGVVVVSNFNTFGYGGKSYAAILGFDSQTGKKLWEVKGPGGPNAVPATWTHQGKNYVIANGVASEWSKEAKDALYCIDPKTGELVWSATTIGNSRAFTVHGDYVLIANNISKHSQEVAANLKEYHALNKKIKNLDFDEQYLRPSLQQQFQKVDLRRKELKHIKGVACYSLRQKGKKLWLFEGYGSHGSLSHPTVYKNEAIIQTNSALVWVDMSSGDVVHRIDGRPAISMPLRIGNRLLIEIDGTHSYTHHIMLDLDNKTVMNNPWSPPHAQTTSYSSDQSKPFAEGRMYFRGFYSLASYDLRKVMQVDHTSATDGRVQCKVVADWLQAPDLIYSWSFSDGSTKKGREVEHQFATPKGHSVAVETVKLVITSSNGMRRVAEKKIYLCGSLIPAQQTGKVTPGVITEYHLFSYNRQKPLLPQVENRQAEESWITFRPTKQMAINDKAGVFKIHGYIRVPQQGIYYFTPFRSAFGGMIEDAFIKLYVGQRQASRGKSRFMLPLQAGLHPFTMLVPVHKKLTSDNMQLLLSPAEIPTWRKPLPLKDLLRPSASKNATVWTGKRPLSASDQEAKEEADFLEEIEGDVFEEG